MRFANTKNEHYESKVSERTLSGAEGYRYACLPDRQGYQGEFAEEDSETGWFRLSRDELRIACPDTESSGWDGRIGRWISTDPANQYPSPYLGMGNDPVNGIDPDGGFKTKFWANFYWALNGFRGEIVELNEEGMKNAPGHKYAIHLEGGSFNPSDGVSVGTYSKGVIYPNEIAIAKGIQRAWDSNTFQSVIPDYIYFGGNVQGIWGGGIEAQQNFVILLRGPDISLIPRGYTTVSAGFGFDVSAGAQFGSGRYFGSVKDFNRNTFIGPTMNASFAVTEGGDIGIGGSIGLVEVPNKFQILTSSSEINIGVGVPLGPVPVNGSVTGGYTFKTPHPIIPNPILY